ncbi:MAG: pseudouridine synthase [Alphaproteobacteria bacterium]|nr:pseudouridine synthase [Alphaproteobacteria bacterium]
MENNQSPKPERIAKRIAAAGVCSRRQAETLIEEGKVSVNGKIITSPALNVILDDHVVVQGKPLDAPQQSRLFRFHKPKGCLCTTKDPEGRQTIYDILPPNLPRVVSIGRLDFNSEGLLLLTTDGALAEKWMRGDHERVYRVRVYGQLTDDSLARLRKGLKTKHIFYKPMKIEMEPTEKSARNFWYRITLTEGKNREIRNAIEAVGGQVTRLIRVAYGPADLGSIPRKSVVEVPQNQLKKWQKEA